MKSFIFTIFLVAVAISTSMAQLPCDFNQNGVIFEISDMVWLIGFFQGYIPPDSFPTYWPEGDCDCDSIHLTISDLEYFYYVVLGTIPIGRGQVVESTADTIALPSVSAVPGQLLSLPITIQPSRLLHGFQFHLNYDTMIVSQVEFRWSDTLYAGTPFQYPGGYASHKLALDPFEIGGTIGWLDFRVNEDVGGQIETAIEFADNTRIAKYTGLSLIDTIALPPEPQAYFIRPIKINGHITIEPTAVADRSEPEDSRPLLTICGNPGNPEFTIKFHLPSDGDIGLDLFNVLGQRTAEIAAGYFEGGWHQIVLDASGIPSGTYFCRLATETERVSAKVTLLK
ncbi:MAG: hypothetical protein A2W25_02465 [candidate division Zixibacteria bacterium RBG_16_53_22]|nr:MAG: hypothetical protein A2W25_02465 [candidate division Zixibacteria bacterium RBG_16_53_22]